MARKVQGCIFKRGKKGYYYLKYELKGQRMVNALRDDAGKPITSKRLAQKAADIILAPCRANDVVQLRQQVANALKNAEDKAQEIELASNAIKIPDAHKLAMQKPRRRNVSESSRKRKGTHWNDFAMFMANKFSTITTMDKVTKAHAEKYTQHLIEKGRYNTTRFFTRKNKTSSYTPATTVLSSRTINSYMVSINEIFNLLTNDGGYQRSPFADIPKQELIQVKREAFTEEELQLIVNTGDKFIVPLFTVGLCTGLREADICLLEWREVDLPNNIITRITRKTGKEVTIPIMPPLKNFLKVQLAKNGNSIYVLPEHAEMYLENPCGISRRVKKILDDLQIKNTDTPNGRAVSIKDVHSLRHSFCYYAGVYNVPLIMVQAVVGHMSPEMTKHYSMHATSNDIKNAFQDMPDIFGLLDSTSTRQLPESVNNEPERQELMKRIEKLPMDKIRELLSLL